MLVLDVAMADGAVVRLRVFPVRGEPGRDLEVADVQPEGVVGDRRKKAAVHVVAAADDAPTTRANIVVSLTPTLLATSIGRRLRVGEVALTVTGVARDCPGVYAEVSDPGEVRLGEPVGIDD